MFVNRKSVQLVAAIRMLIGFIDIFVSLTRQKARNDMARTFYISVEKRGTVTNGDVIKAMFPNIRIIDMPDVEVVQVVNEENDIFWGESRNFHYTWWNSPYKEE